MVAVEVVLASDGDGAGQDLAFLSIFVVVVAHQLRHEIEDHALFDPDVRHLNLIRPAETGQPLVNHGRGQNDIGAVLPQSELIDSLAIGKTSELFDDGAKGVHRQVADAQLVGEAAELGQGFDIASGGDKTGERASLGEVRNLEH